LRRARIRVLTALALFLLAGAAGYILSSSIGQQILREEANRQLTKLMRGSVTVEQLHLRLHLALEIEGDNVSAYPGPGGPALFARHVSATVDLLSLLMGRPRLRRLKLDEARMRIERLGQGLWSPAVVARLGERERERRGEEDPERHLGVLRAIEATTRALLAEAHVADLVEINGGHVTFIDAVGDAHRPLAFRLERIRARLKHRWLPAEADFDLRAILKDGQGRRTWIEAEGRRQRNGGLRLALAATGFELEALEPYLMRRQSPISLRGEASGVVVFDTTEPGHGNLELDWSLDDVATRLTLRLGQLELDSPLSQLRARLEIHPRRLRLTRAELGGSQLALQITGGGERPLTDASIARISADLRGVRPDEVRRIANALPAKSRESLTGLLERIESGRIAHLWGSGSARLSDWRQLVTGKLAELPEGFVLAAELSDLAMAMGDGDRLTDFGAAVEWSGDRIEVRDGHGMWNGEELPALNVTVDGVSNLVANPDEEWAAKPATGSLAGLSTLRNLLRGDRERAETAAVPRVQLSIDALHHPALGRRLARALATIEPIEHGLQVSVTQGSLGGALIRGEAVYVSEPERTLNLVLEVRSPQQGADTEVAPVSLDEGAWAAGRFEVTPTEPEQSLFSALLGRFELSGSTLLLSQVRADLRPSGSLKAAGSLNLDRPGEIPIEVTLHLTEGDIAALSGTLGQPQLLVSGRLNLQARLSGALREKVPPLSDLTGDVSAAARNGTIRRELPVVVAMAQATEGFNRFSRGDSLQFETVQMTLSLDRGRVSTDDFRMESPVRVFASGWADLGRPSQEIDAVVGVFLFRQANQVLGNLPLVNILIPGSDRGLVGAYFELSGQWNDPQVTGLPMKSLAEGLPDVLKTPLKVIQSILTPGKRKTEHGDTPRPPEKPETP
jgi:hypothetical protein